MHVETNDPYAAAQDHDFVELQRARALIDTLRRIASGEAIALVGMALAIILLASHYQHDVFVYRDDAHGLTYQGQAEQTLTPSQSAIEQQLGYFIKAVRNVPGIDYRQADQNITLALQMTIDAPPQRAHQDMLAYLSDHANNPKLLGYAGEIRTVIDPVIVSPVSAQSWTISWVEESRRVGQKATRTFHQGTVMIAPPTISTDPKIASINSAGVEVMQYDLHI
jgi:type IV secretory pathway TrbF-like protein